VLDSFSTSNDDDDSAVSTSLLAKVTAWRHRIGIP